MEAKFTNTCTLYLEMIIIQKLKKLTSLTKWMNMAWT
jgi:hypothetical protein